MASITPTVGLLNNGDLTQLGVPAGWRVTGIQPHQDKDAAGVLQDTAGKWDITVQDSKGGVNHIVIADHNNAAGDVDGWSLSQGPTGEGGFRDPTAGAAPPQRTPDQAAKDAADARTAQDTAEGADALNAERQWEFTHHGVWLTHAEYDKYQQEKDTDARAATEQQSLTDFRKWQETNGDAAQKLEAQRLDIQRHPPIKDQDGNELQWDSDKQSYETPPGYTPGKATAVADLKGRNIVSIDKSGNIVNTQPNPNYEQDAQAQTPNTTAAQIPFLTHDANGNMKIEWVDNKNQVTVPTALLGLYDQLKPYVGTGDGKISLDQAKSMFDIVHQKVQEDLDSQRNAISQQDADTNVVRAKTEQQRADQEAVRDQETARNNDITSAQKILDRRQTAVDTIGTQAGQQMVDLAKNVRNLPAGFSVTPWQSAMQMGTQLAGGQGAVDAASNFLATTKNVYSGITQPVTDRGSAEQMLNSLLQARKYMTGSTGTATAPFQAPVVAPAPQPMQPPSQPQQQTTFVPLQAGGSAVSNVSNVSQNPTADSITAGLQNGGQFSRSGDPSNTYFFQAPGA